MTDPRLVEALHFQRAGFGSRSLASPLYAALTDAILADLEGGGPCAAVFDQVPPGLDPIPDAVVLRFLGAVHRLVLTGAAPDLARWFPTTGGSFDPAAGADPGPDLLDAVATHADDLVAGLSQPVQTNEVGRCATLAVGFTELLRRFDLPLRLLEVGASAGLNLRWDRWRYESGTTAWGDADAPLRFGDDVYRDPVPDVSAPRTTSTAVAERWGCDRAPVDPASEEGRLLLRSFVWPDQAERHARLDAAIAVAAEVPATVERVDAADFVRSRASRRMPGTTTVVYHSIVWQYLPVETRESITRTLRLEGGRARPDAPLAWLRMEPPPDPSEAAELRMTTWSGRDPEERLLAHSGYHGRPVRRA